MRPPFSLLLTRLQIPVLLTLSLGLMLFALAGCGGGSSSVTTPAASGTAAAFEEVNDFTLQPTLKTLPQDGSVQITSVTADSVTLSGAVPPLLPGDTILSNDTLPDGTFGLIRKVVTISQNGAETVVQTQLGDLADVFQTADIHQRTSFPAAAFENLSPGTPGVTFGTPVSSRSPTGGRAQVERISLPINFRNVYVQAADGTVIAELNGQLTLEAGVEAQLALNSIGVGSLRVPNGVRSLIVAPYVSATGKVTVRTRVKGRYVKQIPISDPAHPLEFNFGLGPVALNTKLNLYAQVDGDFDGTGDITLDGSVFLSAGLGGGEAINKGVNEFGAYRDTDYNYKISVGDIFPHTTLHVNASLMQPEGQLNLAGLGGVFARLDALRAESTISYTFKPGVGNIFLYTLDGRFLATVGGQLRLLGLINLLDGEINVIDLPFSIAKFYRTDKGQTTPPPSTPGQSTGTSPGDIGIILR